MWKKLGIYLLRAVIERVLEDFLKRKGLEAAVSGAPVVVLPAVSLKTPNGV